jgi:hypothetical protein
MAKELKSIIKGEYVATPIKNAFNDKISYWLSKKDCTIAIYMFSIQSYMNDKDLEEMLSPRSLDSYIKILEDKLKA